MIPARKRVIGAQQAEMLVPKTLSVDLRERVVEAYRSGTASQREVAKRFGVGVASVKRWWRRWREDATLKARPRLGATRMVDAAGVAVFAELALATPDATRDELADALQERIGVTISVATAGRMLRRLGLTRKKRRS